jgi:hypothetical protein
MNYLHILILSFSIFVPAIVGGLKMDTNYITRITRIICG